MKDLQFREVSLVARPADPEARLTELPIDTQDLVQHLGPAFTVGGEVSCDLCLRGCWGFTEWRGDDPEPSGERRIVR